MSLLSMEVCEQASQLEVAGLTLLWLGTPFQSTGVRWGQEKGISHSLGV